MPILEKDIEGPVRTWALKHGFIVVKVRFLEVGYPDRLFISPGGHTIFIEFKRPGEHPTKIQLYRIAQLKARGVPAYWTDNYVTAVSILREALAAETVPRESDPPAPVASIGGPVLGSGVGQDFDGTGYLDNSEIQGFIQEGFDHRANSADVPDVASGDQEVD